MPRRSLLAVALLSASLWTGACNKPVAPAPGGKAAKGSAAPEFALKDADGRTVNLADYKGKVVLLNFWATWCGPCKIEIPWFMEFEKQYKDRGFAVLGVSMDEGGWEDVKPFLAKQPLNYRVLLGDPKTADLYGGVASLPTTFVIDRGGRITSTHVGLVSKSDYQNDIDRLLEQKTSRGYRAPEFGMGAALMGAVR